MGTVGSTSQILASIAVLPSGDISRDTDWYYRHTGFSRIFGDHMYAGLKRGEHWIHLQWHADTEDDPLLGGSVVKFFVTGIEEFVEEFVRRGTIDREKFRRNTPWGTHEFGFYDPNGNALFFVQDAD